MSVRSGSVSTTRHSCSGWQILLVIHGFWQWKSIQAYSEVQSESSLHCGSGVVMPVHMKNL